MFAVYCDARVFAVCVFFCVGFCYVTTLWGPGHAVRSGRLRWSRSARVSGVGWRGDGGTDRAVSWRLGAGMRAGGEALVVALSRIGWHWFREHAVLPQRF